MFLLKNLQLLESEPSPLLKFLPFIKDLYDCANDPKLRELCIKHVKT